VQETIGGGIFGFVIGYFTYLLVKSIDNYRIEVLLTLALVMGGYAAARAMHISGPIAIVVAGLFIGNQGRSFAMTDTTRENLDTFWELIDEILNAAARFTAVGIPVSLMKLRQSFHPHVISILTWGGIRGGISVALALSLPKGQERDIIVAMTYVIVIMSVTLQGLTIKSLVQYAAGKSPVDANSTIA